MTSIVLNLLIKVKSAHSAADSGESSGDTSSNSNVSSWTKQTAESCSTTNSCSDPEQYCNIIFATSNGYCTPCYSQDGSGNFDETELMDSYECVLSRFFKVHQWESYQGLLNCCRTCGGNETCSDPDLDQYEADSVNGIEKCYRWHRTTDNLLAA